MIVRGCGVRIKIGLTEVVEWGSRDAGIKGQIFEKKIPLEFDYV
jgi:hypothetical protein